MQRLEIATEYKNIVLQSMINKTDDGLINCDPSHPNYTKFVTAVKVIIEWGQDVDNGFILEFNRSCTKLRKRKVEEYGKTITNKR